ncbi:ABC-2 type transport system permease protein [Saccharopolyspora lacisalsi]|uniref:ABC-2 type transport system permease protein n=1 Tax=Halosaccharopolyspora lacisalsi TaxID=1000566 RepID=A0A839DUA6_9PSEU|nr:hypothetical protein [Halosaccharopolyspora lacisalsi]MBA8822721.1 ABC-2 type transport system permease protein [Halosaccharopolyspora lacisalsi]
MTALSGTGALIRLVLRRDRVRIPVWVLGIAGTVLGSVSSFPAAYSDAASRQARAALMNNPATVIMTGPGYGLDHYTFGAMTANEMGGLTAVASALMSILLVVRHTRAEEESGRGDLVRAAVVGRHAATTAALVVVLGANVLLGAVIAAGLPTVLPALGAAGSLLFGASVTAVGAVFTGVAAVTAQVMEHSRAATGSAGALLATAFALRAAGDLGDGTLSWLSPIGWAQATRAYVDGRWWPLLPACALTALAVAAAYALRARRDEGAGLVRTRSARTSASARLNGAFGLALRLQRGLLAGWVLGFVVFGLFIGSMADQAASFVAENEMARRFFTRLGAGAATDALLATYMSLMAMVGTGYALQAVSLPRSEETAGHVEPLLGGTPLNRPRWLVGHLAATLLGSVLVVGLAGASAGLMFAATTGDVTAAAPVLLGALAHLPAVWVLVGVAVALFGLAPAAGGLVWAALAGVVFVGTFGPLLRLPEWVSNLSPFAHTPRLPGAEFTTTPLVVLTVLAVGLMVVGTTAFSRRDVG